MTLLPKDAQGRRPVYTLRGLKQRQVALAELEGELDAALERKLANAVIELTAKVIGDGAHGGGSIGALPSRA